MRISKRFVALLLCAVLAVAMLTNVLAAEKKSIAVNSDMSIMLDGELFTPRDASGNAVEVFEYNGTTYVPLRAVASALGAEIGYDDATRTAHILSPGMTASSDTDPVFIYALGVYNYITSLSVNGEFMVGSLSDILSRMLTGSTDAEAALDTLVSMSENMESFSAQIVSIETMGDTLGQSTGGFDVDTLNVCAEYLMTAAEGLDGAIYNLYYFLTTGSEEYLNEFYTSVTQADSYFYSVWSYSNEVYYEIYGILAA